MKMTLKLIKYLIYLGAIAVFVVCSSAYLHRNHLRILAEFESLKEYNPTPRAQDLVKEGKICEAIEYLEAFLDYDYIREDPEIMNYYYSLRAERESLVFRASDVARGVYYGKGACAESFISSTVSDFLIIGDVRDLTRNAALKYYYKEEGDNFVMALAGVGIVASVITYASAGTAGGAKASISAVKIAKTAGVLSNRLQQSLLPLMKKTIRTRDIKHIWPVLSAIDSMRTVHGLGLRNTLTVLSKCHSAEDILRAEKAVAQLGPDAARFVRSGGGDVLSIVNRFSKSSQITPAVETSIKYGKEGSALLNKYGPSKFLHYVTLTKYSARTIRSLKENRLSALLFWLALNLSQGALFTCALLSGSFIVLASYCEVIG
jgi:hypothetical protein